MKISRRTLFINSTLAFVSAFFVTTFIHEGGHFIAYLLAGAHPVLYHNYVQTPDKMGMGTEIFGALAGPVISLFQGMILGAVVIRRRGERILDLLLLWLSLLGFVNFFGYLLLTPLSTAGDTGKVAELLHVSYPIRILVAIIGIILLLIIVKRLGKFFSNFIPATHDITEKRKYVNSILFFPIIAGSIINTAFAFPIPVAVSAIYPATSSFVIMSAFGVILRDSASASQEYNLGEKISGVLISLLIACIILNRVLTGGVSF